MHEILFGGVSSQRSLEHSRESAFEALVLQFLPRPERQSNKVKCLALGPFLWLIYCSKSGAAPGAEALIVGIIERGVPQAYIRARASSETLRSVHVSRVFLCIFFIKMGN